MFLMPASPCVITRVCETLSAGVLPRYICVIPCAQEPMLPKHRSRLPGLGPSPPVQYRYFTLGALIKTSPGAEPSRHSPATFATQYLYESEGWSEMRLPGPLMSRRDDPPLDASVASCLRASGTPGTGRYL